MDDKIAVIDQAMALRTGGSSIANSSNPIVNMAKELPTMYKPEKAELKDNPEMINDVPRDAMKHLKEAQ
jgi:hypothetical protein